ncbi:hypothetical protein T472_0215860 [Youngiibacter fragilis 232.1]|uniref:Uncharacterized protein n=1 Tax=Youngiibacter fragilis 232.1 TaxID=994573 RepID=V7I2Y7_9CLOT|nr:hypothetical protein T472_0215860 [Youngiibacter fragilis 232.1]
MGIVEIENTSLLMDCKSEITVNLIEPNQHLEMQFSPLICLRAFSEESFHKKMLHSRM